MLTLERARALLVYDPADGVIRWRVSNGSRARAGSIAGAIEAGGYIRICIDGRFHRAHRLAWLLAHGAWPTRSIDHINGNKADNRLCNLRDVTANVNLQNIRRARSDNRSGLLGVARDKTGFRAVIKVAGKQKYLGTFPTPELAHSAYLSAKRLLHEGNTL
jgi:hypothetical protein